MNAFWKNTLSTVLALAALATAGGVLETWQEVAVIKATQETISAGQNARLDRMESKLDQLAGSKTIAEK